MLATEKNKNKRLPHFSFETASIFWAPAPPFMQFLYFDCTVPEIVLFNIPVSPDTRLHYKIRISSKMIMMMAPIERYTLLSSPSACFFI